MEICCDFGKVGGVLFLAGWFVVVEVGRNWRFNVPLARLNYDRRFMEMRVNGEIQI
jgi:hypothetical protein